MGWTPGSELGTQGTGRTTPVEAVVRSKYLGKHILRHWKISHQIESLTKITIVKGLGHGSKSNDMNVEESLVEAASMASAM